MREALRPAYPNNARVIPPSAIEKVAASIRAFGWRQPVVVDSAGVIVVGHVRLLAAQSIALTEVHVARDLPPGQVKAYRLSRHFLARTARFVGHVELEITYSGFDTQGFGRLQKASSRCRISGR